MGGSGDSTYNPTPSARPKAVQLGGAGAGGSGGQEGEDDPCARLSFSSTLDSPEPDVVNDFEPGVELDVVLTEEDGTLVVVARTEDGEIAGTITNELPDLIRCLRGDRAFVAVVREVDGGAVRVDVHPAP